MASRVKLLAHDATQALALLAPIVRVSVPSDNEAQTEQALSQPVLRALDHICMRCQA
jgi:hypothetical protein